MTGRCALAASTPKVSLNAGPVDNPDHAAHDGRKRRASRLEYQDKHSSFTGLGVGYDNGKLLAQGEYTIRKAGGFWPTPPAGM